MTYILRKNPRLWVFKKSDQFVHHSILLALYKDLFTMGYKKLFIALLKKASKKKKEHTTVV